MVKKHKGVKDADAKRVSMSKKRGTYKQSRKKSYLENFPTPPKVIELNADGEYIWKEYFNHHPAYPGIWVVYNTWRLKEHYDIKLRDGTILTKMYPNGNSWYGGQASISDTAVAEIRLIPAAEDPWGVGRADGDMLTQSYVINRAFGMWDESIFPTVNKDANTGDITFTPKKYRFYDKGVKNSTGEIVNCLREGEFTENEVFVVTASVLEEIADLKPLTGDYAKVLHDNLPGLYLK